MRVLIAHNRYQQEGGEDGVVANEERLLVNNGVDVVRCIVTNDVISDWRTKLSTLANVAYSVSARDDFAARLKATKPDVVHVHNFFPLLTPSIYDACKQAGVTVVQTLHNYRTICAGALLMRDGEPCERCVGGSPYWGALYGCYRNSSIASAGVAHMISSHHRRGTWHTQVDRFIALSKFARSRFVAGGLPGERIAVKPNVVFGAPPTGDVSPFGALYVGRLSQEKGVVSLAKAWQQVTYPLTVAGEGPLGDEMRALADGRVSFLGRIAPERVRSEMEKAAFIVLPSVCFENFPLTIAEAFSCGRPAIVSRIGALAEIVEDGKTGLHFNPGDPDDLAAKVRWAAANPDAMMAMGRNAQGYYARNLAPRANFAALNAIYSDAIANRNASQTCRSEPSPEVQLKEHVA